MDIQISYFVYSLLFLVIWAVIFSLRKDLRRKMLLASSMIAPMGLISEIWYLEDYWSRSTITGTPIGVEDAIFAFAIGGISFAGYKVLTNQTISATPSFERRTWLMVFFGVVVISLLLIFTNGLRINSIFTSSAGFIAFAVVVWRLRPDLIKPSITTAFILLFLFVLVYQLMEVLFPGVLTGWCKGCNPSGIRLLGINVEELLWDFSWGLVGGIAYESVTGRTLIKRTGAPGPPAPKRHLTNYDNYDSNLATNDPVQLQTDFGKFMAATPRRILSIRIARQLAYWFSRYTRKEIPVFAVLILVPLVAPLLNVILYPLGSACEGTSFLWMVYYVMLNFCLLIFPQYAWTQLMRISDNIDLLLNTTQQKSQFIGWLNQRLSLRLQVAASIMAGLVGVATVKVATDILGPVLTACPASYLSVFITSGLGMNAVYWLWVVPFLIRRLAKFPSLQLTWYSPVDTPSVRYLSGLLSRSSVLAALGLVLFTIPLLWFYNAQRGGEPLVLFSAAGFLISLGTVFFITAFPQYWLSEIVVREKSSVLSSLELHLDGDLNKHLRSGDWANLDAKISILQSIRNSPTSTINTEGLASYTLALITTAFPYLVSWLFKQ